MKSKATVRRPRKRPVAKGRWLSEVEFSRLQSSLAEAQETLDAIRGGEVDAVVVDVYTSSNAIPGHLLTAEFWRTTRRVLSTDGVVMANLVLDPALRSAFAHNVLATIEQELGRCAVEVLQRQWAASNVVVTCLPAQQGPRRARPYTDERSSADFDRAMGLR